MDDKYEYEEYYADANPSDEEIRQYALFIGIDPDKDPELLDIAAEGISAPLPPNWKLYRNKNDPDDYFFFNSETGQSINDHPLDQYYINKAKEKLEEKYDKSSKREKNRGKGKHKKRNTSPPPQEEENNVFLLEDDDITSEEPPTLKAKTNNLDPNANYNNNMYTNEEGNKKSHGSHSKHRSRSHTVSQSNFQAYNDEIQQMKENNNEQLRLLQEEFENQKAELERDHQKKLNDLKISQRNEEQQEENILREIENRRKSKENELQNIDNELSMTKNQQKSQIDILKSQHDQFIDTLKNQNNSEIERLKQTFEETKKQIQDEQNKLIEDIKKKNEEEINQIKKDHLKEKNEIINRYKAEIAELKNQNKSKIEKMRAKHEKQLSEIRAKAANHLETERKKYETPTKQQNLRNSLSPSSNYSSPQNYQRQQNSIREHDYKKESIEAINRFDEYTKKELDKRRREYEIQLSKLITSHSEEMAKKNTEHIQLVNQLEQVKQQYNEEIRKTKENAQNEKRNIMKQMQKDVSIAKRKELRERKRTFICQTQRIVSIKGKDSIRSSRKIRLKRSDPHSISIDDDFEINFRFSPPHTIFQVYCKTLHHSLQKDRSQVFDKLNNNDSDDSEIATRKKDNTTAVSPNKTNYIEISEDEHQKIKYSFQKVQQQFDSSARKIENKMDGVLTDINGQVKELRSFMQEENRFMNKSTLEFHQQILDITRNFHNSLSELESEHYTAVSAMNSIKNKAENIPQPTQIIVAPPLSPQPYYSYISPTYQGQIVKRPRRYNTFNRESDTYYDSDFD